MISKRISSLGPVCQDIFMFCSTIEINLSNKR